MAPSATLAGGVRKGTLTRDLVIEKILRWNALYGEPPCTADWNPSLARWRAQEWRIERYRLGDPETGERWPSVNAAKRRFDGSFDAAVRAAGLVPHRPGPRRPARSVLPAVAQREPRAPREVEAELVAAGERVLEAERRALRAEERVRRAVAQAESAVSEARERASGVERRAAERVRATERVRSVPGLESERRARAERRRAAAELRAADAEQALRAADARAAELERALQAAEARGGRAAPAATATATDPAATARATLDPAVATTLRNGSGPVGPGPLAEALKALAAARASGDRTALNEALTSVASAAVRWRERL